MEPTDEDYIKLINKTFIRIGIRSPTPKTMAFMADGETQEFEEPDGTFSSMNFVWKLIMELPGKSYVLMNKQQAIRFIRVVKQRILKVLNADIDFINIHLSRVERRAFNKKINGRFIEKLTNRIRDVEKKYNITDEDLYEDTPTLVQRYIPSPYLPSPHEPSPEYESLTEYESVNNSVIVKDISFFEDEMNLIDIEDEEKYTEKDTPDILSNIAILKKEFLDRFTQNVHMLSKQYYDKEVKTLTDELIQFYTERLPDIRKSAHFRDSRGHLYGKTMVEVRREKEQTRKQLYEEHRKRAFSQNNVVLRPRPLPPKPRARKPRTVSQNNTKPNNSLTLKKVPVLPKPRSRKSRSASQNNTQSNIPKPKARSRAFSQNNTRTNRPKPRARSRAFSQNNTTL